MNLTKEQKAIINHFNDCGKMKILAFAGSGKTSTLVELAKAYPQKKFLYLSFNKSIQVEAEKKFPSNTQSKTIHSLAYYFIVRKGRYKVDNINPFSISKLIGCDFTTSTNVLKAFESFCNSDKKEPEGEFSEFVKRIYLKMKKGEVPVNHSFYLKEFHLKLLNGEIPPVTKFDCVLLDEAQDTNPVTQSIFSLLKAEKKVIVGDRHQQIYSFRGAVDALENFEAQELYLTNSFRLSKEVAQKANYFLKIFKNEEKEIIGLNQHQTIKSRAFLSRSNSSLIDKISALLKENKSFTFTRDPYEIFGLSLNVLYKTTNKSLDKRFNFLSYVDLNKIKEQIENGELNDYELKKAIENYEKYGNRLITLYQSSKENYLRYRNNYADVDYVLSTAHSAKGLEFDNVILLEDFNLIFKLLADFFIEMKIKRDTDFYSLIKKYAKEKKFPVEIQNEFNLFYVALTRAKVRAINRSNVTHIKHKINSEIASYM